MPDVLSDAENAAAVLIEPDDEEHRGHVKKQCCRDEPPPKMTDMANALLALKVTKNVAPVKPFKPLCKPQTYSCEKTVTGKRQRLDCSIFSAISDDEHGRGTSKSIARKRSRDEKPHVATVMPSPLLSFQPSRPLSPPGMIGEKYPSIGRPLAPAPFLPRLKPGQTVMLS